MKAGFLKISHSDIRNFNHCPKCGSASELYIISYSEFISVECDKCGNHMVLEEIKKRRWKRERNVIQVDFDVKE